MAVYKRTWKSGGKEKFAWMADYYVGKDRFTKSFRTKGEADAYMTKVKVEKGNKTHVPEARSITVKLAAESWLRSAEHDGLEKATIKQYREHVNLHIVPLIGTTKLCDLSVAAVRRFEDRLQEEGRSPAMRRKVLGSLGALLADAQEHGQITHNTVRELSKKRRRGKVEERHKRKITAGVDLPTIEEARAIMTHAPARWRPVLVTAILCGLRASELRGLRWCDVDGDKLHVRQRADRFNEIGSPKSASSERTIPLPVPVRNALREWRLKREGFKRDDDLVFANGNGNPESHANIVNRGLIPAQIAAGVVTPDGKAKYTGLHCLRHFFASWCLTPRDQGGCGYTLKQTSELMGHSTSIVTANVYEHLLPTGDDGAVIDAAALALIG